jgi:hypothetical protein
LWIFVYLEHLLFNGQIAVADHATRRAIYFSEEKARELIASGQIEIVWPRKKRGLIRGLNWIGQPLKAQTNGTMTVEQDELGPDMHSSAPYSNKHESPSNVENVWTHAGRTTVLGHAFVAVVGSCGALILSNHSARARNKRPPSSNAVRSAKI